MEPNTIDRESQEKSLPMSMPPKVADIIDRQIKERGQDDYDPIEYQHHSRRRSSDEYDR